MTTTIYKTIKTDITMTHTNQGKEVGACWHRWWWCQAAIQSPLNQSPSHLPAESINHVVHKMTEDSDHLSITASQSKMAPLNIPFCHSRTRKYSFYYIIREMQEISTSERLKTAFKELLKQLIDHQKQLAVSFSATLILVWMPSNSDYYIPLLL